MASDQSRLERELRKQGWKLEYSTKHLKAFPPDGGPFVLLPSTMGEGRSFQNCVAMLRRQGFKWKGR